MQQAAQVEGEFSSVYAPRSTRQMSALVHYCAEQLLRPATRQAMVKGTDITRQRALQNTPMKLCTTVPVSEPEA
jgi:hypothetical protein